MPSAQSLQWMESLGQQEALIHKGLRNSLDLSQTQEHVLELETTVFLRDLTAQMGELVACFNQHVVLPELRLILHRKPTPAPQLPGDILWVERSGVLLAVCRMRHGVLQLQAFPWDQRDMAPPVRRKILFSGTLEARFSVCFSVDWYFLGNAVEAEQAARHFLTEFIQSTRKVIP